MYISLSVNTEVLRVNDKISKLCKYFKNVSVVDLSKIGQRFHTRHGLHLNDLGKQYIASKILEMINVPKTFSQSCKPIPLGPKN